MNESSQPRIVVVYESMFGNTRLVAEAIAEGIRATLPVTLVPIAQAGGIPDDIDVLIVGGPTHVHGMSRPESRAEAKTWAASEKPLDLDEAWHETGVREWLAGGPPRPHLFAAFDTRVDMPRLFTGSAAAVIDRKLAKVGGSRLSPPMSFLVDKDSRLEDGEIERARAWGAALTSPLAATPLP